MGGWSRVFLIRESVFFLLFCFLSSADFVGRRSRLGRVKQEEVGRRRREGGRGGERRREDARKCTWP